MRCRTCVRRSTESVANVANEMVVGRAQLDHECVHCELFYSLFENDVFRRLLLSLCGHLRLPRGR